MISFYLNEQRIDMDDVRADLTLLDWLRTHRHLTGTKEGCGSGDCGACTVTVAELHKQQVVYRSLNSCIALVGSLHGKQLLTVEYLSAVSQPLHPVQQAMVDQHASQCGFCTPGFVMSLYTLHCQLTTDSGTMTPVTTQDLQHCMAGNLCRCTGYRPILDAARQSLQSLPSGQHSEQQTDRQPGQQLTEHHQALTSLTDLTGQLYSQQADGEHHYLMPQNVQQALAYRQQYPQARWYAGGTDMVLEVTQDVCNLPVIIDLQQVAELQVLDSQQGLTIGAAVTYADCLPALLNYCPEAEELFMRLGSAQIRHAGTLGGSLGTASPIGDPAPLLMALNAMITLASVQGQRQVNANDFFTGYRQTVCAADELIVSIHLPARPADDHLQVYKISKRYEDDISIACGVYYWQLADEKIQQIRIAMGGMAAVPQRARQTEAALNHQPLGDPHALEKAMAALTQDYRPISDARASADYRRQVAQGLLQRAWYSTPMLSRELAETHA